MEFYSISVVILQQGAALLPNLRYAVPIMKMSQLVGKRTKETPKDAQSPSHIFLIRGGYVRQVSTGIFSLLPLARRITQKIENIIREEMNHIEGQEVLMPVVLPRELWEESGRY